MLGLALLAIAAGCQANEEVYHQSIQKGYDAIATETYEKAAVYFETALEEKPDDEQAGILLEQTENYTDAVKAVEDGDLDKAMDKAMKSEEVKDGSEGIRKKAGKLQEDIQLVTSELTEQAEAEKGKVSQGKEPIETGKINLEQIEKQKGATNKTSESIIPENQEKEVKQAALTINDFEGHYAAFIGEPFNSELDYVIYVNEQHFVLTMGNHYEVGDIESADIEGNTLYLHYYLPPNMVMGDGEESWEDVKLTLIYREDGSKQTILQDKETVDDISVETLQSTYGVSLGQEVYQENDQ